MCQSMVNIQSPAAEIRRGKKEEERTNHSMKIYMVSLLHRATIKNKLLLSFWTRRIFFLFRSKTIVKFGVERQAMSRDNISARVVA